MGQERFELSTPRLSSVCSNQLSYWPVVACLVAPLPAGVRPAPAATPGGRLSLAISGSESRIGPSKLNSKSEKSSWVIDLRAVGMSRRTSEDSRKEVIQPQVPLRLPCYDFTPVTSHSLGACFPCGLAQPLLEQLTPMV